MLKFNYHSIKNLEDEPIEYVYEDAEIGLNIIVLESLEDFDPNDYHIKHNIVVKFKDSGHIFTYGDIDAYLDNKDTLHGKHTESTNLYSWAIAFGDGNAINKGHGPAVTFGKGNAYSFNKSITFGTGDAIIDTSLSYKELTISDFNLNTKQFDFYKEMIDRLKLISLSSYAETYGMGKAIHKHSLKVNDILVDKHKYIFISKNHGYTKEDGSWSLPENTPILKLGTKLIGVSMNGIGKSIAFNAGREGLYENSIFIDNVLNIKYNYNSPLTYITQDSGNIYGDLLSRRYHLDDQDIFTGYPETIYHTGQFDSSDNAVINQ